MVPSLEERASTERSGIVGQENLLRRQNVVPVDYITKLDDDVLVEILKRTLIDGDKYLPIVSSCCKKFYRLMTTEKRILMELPCEFQPEAVKRVTNAWSEILEKANDFGNSRAAYIFALHLIFNAETPGRGLEILNTCDNESTWMRRYVYAMANLKLNEDYHESIASLYSFFQEVSSEDPDDKGIRLICRHQFRQMLRDGKHRMIKYTTLCKRPGTTYHWSRKVEAIKGEGEFYYQCIDCVIDIETYKLSHRIR